MQSHCLLYMFPHPSFMYPKFVNQAIDITVFYESQSAELSLMCAICVLWYYLNNMAAIHSSDQLFICLSAKTQGAPLSKQRLDPWVTGRLIIWLELDMNCLGTSQSCCDVPHGHYGEVCCPRVSVLKLPYSSPDCGRSTWWCGLMNTVANCVAK